MSSNWFARGLAFALVVALGSPGLAGCSSARYGAQETGAPSVILPAHFAEGNTGKSEVVAAPDGGARSATSDAAPPRAGASAAAGANTALPDPPPLVTREHWELALEYDRGVVRVAEVKAVTTARPVATDRRMGRFAIELWLGRELVDRVRFDFPMLAADEPEPPGKRPLHAPVQFGPGAQSARRVLVPASDRATSARLLDRSTGKVTELAWPPVPEARKATSAGQP